jgi:hypothetical protein
VKRKVAAALATGVLFAAAGAAMPWLAGGIAWDPAWFTWPDLTPGGDRDIVYATCGDGITPPEWGQGAEAWDTAMSSLMDFDTLGCALPPASQTVFTWGRQQR